MAQLSPVQIFQVLREAGFTPDEAVNFTAIAMAESGGDTHARLNTSAEDSRGLWQINLHAHRNYLDSDLYDPRVNARAAYEVSNHGTNLYPWSTTHHDHGAASYEKFLAVARHAAVEAGSAPALSHDLGGGGAGSGHHGIDHVRPIEHGELTDSWHAPRAGGHVHEGIDIFATSGTPIHAITSGTVVKGFSDPRGGVVVRIQGDDGNYYYYAHLKPGSEQALHVGQHVGTGDVIGQVGNSGDAATTPSHLHLQVRSGGQWVDPFTFLQPYPDMSSIQSAALLGGSGTDAVGAAAMADGTGTGGSGATDAAAAAAADPYAASAPKPFVDSDHDGLSDDFEKVIGTDPHVADSDHDGLTDYQETIVTHTDPLAVDTDNDGEGDALAVALGHQPGHVPLSPAGQAALAAGGAALGLPAGGAGGPDELTSGFEHATGVGGQPAPAGAQPAVAPVSTTYDPLLATGGSAPVTTPGAAPGAQVGPDGSLIVHEADGTTLHITVEHPDPGHDAHLIDPGVH